MIYPNDINSDTQIFNMNEYSNITNYNKVCVINQFISKVLPELEKKN